ncbi:Seven-in-absentia protein TRAF-like domain [Arabidopsis thaliana x Arabidopsis arenosa]|uniref:RING-type E3 ubiquitin transferase n=1 Tax=Arabidopsis thaliana x Arabidopsis arenosa TaxID=1240361 RepID=A0A8T1YCN2_9BRAS|nr:Seven-in-absentia protein TRAF-like domain [Arabidopsis thaliana x Arabidopsis arenosa]
MDFQSQEIIVAINTENECMEMNEECDEETQGLVRSETQAISVFDSNQHLKADVWKEFVSVGVGEDGKERGHCINCGRKLIIERIYGTSHLRRHLLSCPKKPENKSGGNGEQDRHKRNSTDVKRALVVSKYSYDRRVSNIVWKKRKRRSTSEGKTSSAMLLGLDILDCPICFDALTIPIFQCDNGHLACSSCCPKLSNKCPTCALPIGHNRCRAMESVLESVFVPCRNVKFGCTKKVCYGKESTHEKECTFYQCSCPTLDCNYTGSYNDIYSHFVDDHRHESKSVTFVCGGSVDVQMNIASDKILVLQESKKRLLFALQCFNEPLGLYVTVRCIAPSTLEIEKLAYCLYYSMDGQTLTYKSPEVKRVLEVSSEIPQDNFMFVPHSLLRGEFLEMKISIGLKVRSYGLIISLCRFLLFFSYIFLWKPCLLKN